MRKRMWFAAAVAVAAVIVAGGLYASNMGFKINYRLGQPTELGALDTGRNKLGLPYFRQLGIDLASQLEADIGTAQVGTISRLNRVNNTFINYPGVNFSLLAGEGYQIQMNAGGGTNYVAVGSHDPGQSITLKAATTDGPLDTGRNDFAPPYHTTSTNAAQLEIEIGAAQVGTLSRLNRVNNTFINYPGVNFGLVPGESYRVQMNVGGTVTYTPSHY